MTLFWHTYVLSYFGLGFIILFTVIQYARFCNECLLDEDDATLFTLACTLLWPVFLYGMLQDFYKSHLSHIMAVSLVDIPNAWKAAVKNRRNKNGEEPDSSISTIQKDEIKNLKVKMNELKRINTDVSRELKTIKESVPGSGQQRSMKRLANIIRT